MFSLDWIDRTYWGFRVIGEMYVLCTIPFQSPEQPGEPAVLNNQRGRTEKRKGWRHISVDFQVCDICLWYTRCLRHSNLLQLHRFSYCGKSNIHSMFTVIWSCGLNELHANWCQAISLTLEMRHSTMLMTSKCAWIRDPVFKSYWFYRIFVYMNNVELKHLSRWSRRAKHAEIGLDMEMGS